MSNPFLLDDDTGFGILPPASNPAPKSAARELFKHSAIQLGSLQLILSSSEMPQQLLAVLLSLLHAHRATQIADFSLQRS